MRRNAGYLVRLEINDWNENTPDGEKLLSLLGDENFKPDPFQFTYNLAVADMAMIYLITTTSRYLQELNLDLHDYDIEKDVYSSYPKSSWPNLGDKKGLIE